MATGVLVVLAVAFTSVRNAVEAGPATAFFGTVGGIARYPDARDIYKVDGTYERTGFDWNSGNRYDSMEPKVLDDGRWRDKLPRALRTATDSPNMELTLSDFEDKLELYNQNDNSVWDEVVKDAQQPSDNETDTGETFHKSGEDQIDLQSEEESHENQNQNRTKRDAEVQQVQPTESGLARMNRLVNERINWMKREQDERRLLENDRKMKELLASMQEVRESVKEITTEKAQSDLRVDAGAQEESGIPGTGASESGLARVNRLVNEKINEMARELEERRIWKINHKKTNYNENYQDEI